MSNEPVRLTFPNGTQLYTMGDCWSVVTCQLFDTEDEALDWYDREEAGAARPEGIEGEPVLFASKYGSGEWERQDDILCWASEDAKLITRGPMFANENESR